MHLLNEYLRTVYLPGVELIVRISKYLKTTVNTLLRITFNIPFRTNTDIIFDTYNLLNLKLLHAKEIVCNFYYFNHKDINFKHNYNNIRQKEKKCF